MVDPRQSPRIVDESSVVVTVLVAQAAPDLEGQTFFCKATNTSEGGIMLRVPTEIPQGTEISLLVAFQKPIRSFHLTGDVVWTAPIGTDNLAPIGVRFTSGKGRDMEAWGQIVNQQISFVDPGGIEIVHDPTNDSSDT